MLENARRQLVLVLITLAAALASVWFIKPLLGPDLQGGHQLIFEVPEEVLQKLENSGLKTADVMGQTVSVINQRIDPTGTLDAMVSQRGHNGVIIELPHADKEQLEVIKERIAKLGKLDFCIVATEDFVKDNVQFNLTEEKKRLQDWLNQGGKEAVLDKWNNIDHFNDDPDKGPIARPWLRWVPHLVEPQIDHPELWDRPFSFDTQPQEGISPLGAATVAVFDQQKDWNGGRVPASMQKPESEKKDKQKPFLLEFVALNYKEDRFHGENLDPSKVQPGIAEDGRLAVHYELKPEFTSAYSDWSGRYIKKHSAIVLNGVIRSAPYFVTKIPGRGQISGGFTQSEVDELVKVLRTGSLPVEPLLLSERATGAKLGEHSLFLGEVSLVAGSAAVFAFMLWYYRLSGLVACVTLLLNMLFTYATVVFMQATITLPGLGGIVLTMGMAVDANVLIYERIREETERGKDIIRAVRAGFERAMSAILDSNITTFLSGLVLYNAGVGPVRGFAVTLMIGIVMTVFTQFFVTRLLFHFLLATKRLKDFKVRRFFAQPKIDFFRYVRGWVTASIVLTVGSLAYALFVVPSEISLGIDFKGGANLQMLLQQPTTAEDVRHRLDADQAFSSAFPHATINTIEPDARDRSTAFNIRLKLTDKMRTAIDQARAQWRKDRRTAEEAGTPPPAPFEPEYLVNLKRIFAGELARSGHDSDQLVPGPNGTPWAQINLHFQQPVDVAEATKQLAKAKLPSAKVRAIDDLAAKQARDVFVEWAAQTTLHDWQLFGTVRDALKDFKDTTGERVKLSDPFPEAEEIQGRMVGELRNSAIGALIMAWALIILYLRVRFHEYKWGIGAVVSLLHDVLIALGAVVVANHLGLVHAEIDLNMIACFLTIIGYSVNDTIVIFDRIRENAVEERKMGGKMTLRELVNLSLNQTLSRTILTSGVTLFTVLAQFLVNWHADSDLESFAWGMMVGIITGTYSSVFIATPIVVWIQERWGGHVAGGVETPAAAATTVPQAP